MLDRVFIFPADWVFITTPAISKNNRLIRSALIHDNPALQGQSGTNYIRMFGTMPSNIIDICTHGCFMKPTITPFLPKQFAFGDSQNNTIVVVELKHLKRFGAWHGTRMSRHHT